MLFSNNAYFFECGWVWPQNAFWCILQFKENISPFTV